jgi:hypothetical protein
VALTTIEAILFPEDGMWMRGNGRETDPKSPDLRIASSTIRNLRVQGLSIFHQKLLAAFSFCFGGTYTECAASWWPPFCSSLAASCLLQLMCAEVMFGATDLLHHRLKSAPRSLGFRRGFGLGGMGC